MNTPTIYATRGLPASGKSTWARELVASMPKGSIVRLNRDDLRSMMFGKPYMAGVESVVLDCRNSMMDAALAKGVSVVVDDTNLKWHALSPMKAMAASRGLQLVIVDSFLRVPVEECIRRDALRTPSVGASVICSMWADWCTSQETVTP